MPEEKRENFFTELLKFVLIAVVIVVPVRLFVAQPFIVSGASMEPTFETGQYLIVDELTYHFEAPERGQVIVFQAPKQPQGTYYIKRIIGLPGETVAIQNGQIYITSTNGETNILNEPYLTNIGNGPDMTVTLGPDQYWVMGDNRPESSDSRSWGVLPRANIIGRVFVRLLPLQTISVLPGEAQSTIPI
jgi:signal peptidase I